MSFLMIDLLGTELSSEEVELIQHPSVAGVIFFQRNFTSYQQLSKLVSSIRGAAGDKNLLLSVDQEGGRVQRFHERFTTIPAMGVLGQLDPDKSVRLALIRDLGWLMASEIQSVGIDISYAPVLDVDIGISQVIGLRSFGSEPDTVLEHAKAFVTGMTEAGMAATGKHFPGHGGVSEDSHHKSPVDRRDYEQLFQSELRVFDGMIKQGIKAIMPGHVIYPNIDTKPACFSSYWLKDILRTKLGFKGCIFSDDLSMQGANVMGDPISRSKAALEAGCDILSCCNDRTSLVQIIDGLNYQPNSTISERINALLANGDSSQSLEQIHQSKRYINLISYLQRLES